MVQPLLLTAKSVGLAPVKNSAGTVSDAPFVLVLVSVTFFAGLTAPIASAANASFAGVTAAVGAAVDTCWVSEKNKVVSLLSGAATVTGGFTGFPNLLFGLPVSVGDSPTMM